MKRLSTGLVAAGMLLAVAVPAAASHLSFTRTDYADSEDEVPFPRAVDHADVDDDDDLDVVTANTAHDEVSVLTNDGQRNFSLEASYKIGVHRTNGEPLNVQPWDVIATDVTNDGHPDLVTANFETGDVSVLKRQQLQLLGQRRWTFTHCARVPVGGDAGAALGRFSTGEEPTAVTAADFDDDGHVDIATANSGEDRVAILFGKGDCEFESPKHYKIGRWPLAIAAADLDGDDDPDLVAANCLSHNVSVLLNDNEGDRQFTSKDYAVEKCPRGIAIADPGLKVQGGPDVVTANKAGDSVSVLLNEGDGTFGSASHYDTTTETDDDGELIETSPSGVAVEDFDADGNQDVAVSNEKPSDVGVLTGDGAGDLATVENFEVNSLPYDVIAADFDPSSKPDVVTASLFGHGISVLWNDTN